MKLLATTLAVVLAVLGITPSLNAQDPSPDSQSEKGRVEIKELSAPVYPPLARQTRISGDVRLTVNVTKGGGIASVEVVTGHPLLKQAAVDSVEKTKFGCVECTDSGASQELVYTFAVKGEGDCCRLSPGASTGSDPEALPRVERNENHIVLTDRAFCTCDPAITVIRVRSIRCLYLWHCSVRYPL